MCNIDAISINPGEPTAHPIVLLVVNNVHKGRGSHRKANFRPFIIKLVLNIFLEEADTFSGWGRIAHILKK